MSLTNRHKWIMEILCTMYGLREHEVENTIRDTKTFAAIKDFLDGKGAPRLIF